MNDSKNIANELKDIGIDIPNDLKSPMDVPFNYFTNFSESVLDLIKEEDLLATLPPRMPYEVENNFFQLNENEIISIVTTEDKLESFPKTMPFALPKDYFERIENELKSKIDFQKKEIKPLRYTYTKTQVFSIAASIILILGIGFLFLKPTKTVNIEQQLATISINEINAYIMQHQAEFSTDIVTETIDETSIDVNQLENEIIESQINNLPIEDLKNYL
jgi:hypothetical protein